MKGNTVFQRHYAQVSIQFRDEYPVVDSLILGLYFPAYRVLDRSGTPLKADIRALRQHVIPEIFRHVDWGHQRIKHIN